MYGTYLTKGFVCKARIDENIYLFPLEASENLISI